MWPGQPEEEAGPDLLPFPARVRGSGYLAKEHKQLHTFDACRPGQRITEPTVFVPEVGRCLSMCVPQHSIADTHHKPPLHGRAKLGPTPAAVWAACAQMKARSISQIKFAKIFESSKKLV